MFTVSVKNSVISPVFISILKLLSSGLTRSGVYNATGSGSYTGTSGLANMSSIALASTLRNVLSLSVARSTRRLIAFKSLVVSSMSST